MHLCFSEDNGRALFFLLVELLATSKKQSICCGPNFPLNLICSYCTHQLSQCVWNILPACEWLPRAPWLECVSIISWVRVGTRDTTSRHRWRGWSGSEEGTQSSWQLLLPVTPKVALFPFLLANRSILLWENYFVGFLMYIKTVYGGRGYKVI